VRHELVLAAQAFSHGIGGAVKRDDVAARIDQRRRRFDNPRQEFVDADAMRAGHAQPRHVRGHARRHVPHHLLLHHPVRRRNDQSDARHVRSAAADTWRGDYSAARRLRC
jgi:hypothetical protein